jgi:type IV pilus assembly protein PilB
MTTALRRSILWGGGVNRMPIGESLVNSGVITKEQLEKALDEQKNHPEEKIGQILIKLGYLPMEELESLL